MSAFGRTALLCLKRVRGSPDASTELRRWGGALLEVVGTANGVGALAALLRYVLEVSDTPPDRLRTLAQSLGPRAEEAYVTGAQILQNEGRKEGHKVGRKVGRKEGRAATLLELLEVKFGALSDKARKRVETAAEEQLAEWSRRLLSEDRLERLLDLETEGA